MGGLATDAFSPSRNAEKQHGPNQSRIGDKTPEEFFLS